MLHFLPLLLKLLLLLVKLLLLLLLLLLPKLLVHLLLPPPLPPLLLQLLLLLLLLLRAPRRSTLDRMPSHLLHLRRRYLVLPQLLAKSVESLCCCRHRLSRLTR